jgi:hypothetical protein
VRRTAVKRRQRSVGAGQTSVAGIVAAAGRPDPKSALRQPLTQPTSDVRHPPRVYFFAEGSNAPRLRVLCKHVRSGVPSLRQVPPIAVVTCAARAGCAGTSPIRRIAVRVAFERAPPDWAAWLCEASDETHTVMGLGSDERPVRKEPYLNRRPCVGAEQPK